MDWPVNPLNGLPLHFLAQIHLDALPATPLPKCPFGAALPRTGMLYFFFNFAEYRDDDYQLADPSGAPHQSRVIYAPASGPERAAPANLPKVGYRPGDATGGATQRPPLLPQQHLRAYPIETIWAPGYFKDGVFKRPVANLAELKYEAVRRAVGEPTPIFTSSRDLPSPRPSYYAFVNGGQRSNRTTGLQMFGAASREPYEGDEPRDYSRALLLHYPLEAHELGSLQYWISMSDLKAQRFERVFGEAQFS